MTEDSDKKSTYEPLPCDGADQITLREEFYLRGDSANTLVAEKVRLGLEEIFGIKIQSDPGLCFCSLNMEESGPRNGFLGLKPEVSVGRIDRHLAVFTTFYPGSSYWVCWRGRNGTPLKYETQMNVARKALTDVGFERRDYKKL